MLGRTTPGEKRLVAYVVAETESSLAIDDLRRFLKQKLPEYMMPAVLVPLEAMPLMPNGKMDRQALPAPGANTASRWKRRFVAPRDALETAARCISGKRFWTFDLSE